MLRCPTIFSQKSVNSLKDHHKKKCFEKLRQSLFAGITLGETYKNRCVIDLYIHIYIYMCVCVGL